MTVTRCAICNHPERARIEADLAEGQSKAAVARSFEVGRMALTRHVDNHPQAAEDDGDPLVELVERLRPRGLSGSAAEAREYRLALDALKTAASATAPTRPLVETVEWQRLRSRLLAALRPFPKAAQAVADALADG